MSGSESAVGRLLKNESYRDRSCAGRVMEAVGKSQTYASQQMSVNTTAIRHLNLNYPYPGGGGSAWCMLQDLDTLPAWPGLNCLVVPNNLCQV